MEKLILSQNGVFHLQQLSSLMHDQTGTRHKLSQQIGVFSLLRESSLSHDQAVREHLTALTSELDESQLSELEAFGISPPLNTAN